MLQNKAKLTESMQIVLSVMLEKILIIDKNNQNSFS